jgi:hypothetical protein
MRGWHTGLGATWMAVPLVLAGLLVGTTSCSTDDNKCGDPPVVDASWAGQTSSMENCAGSDFALMPTTSPSANINGEVDIVMKVGQQLTLTKGSGWTNFSAKQPTSDDPTVLRVSQPSKGKTIGVFVAVSPGLADFGALSNTCGTPAKICMFGDVQVTP